MHVWKISWTSSLNSTTVHIHNHSHVTQTSGSAEQYPVREKPTVRIHLWRTVWAVWPLWGGTTDQSRIGKRYTRNSVCGLRRHWRRHRGRQDAIRIQLQEQIFGGFVPLVRTDGQDGWEPGGSKSQAGGTKKRTWVGVMGSKRHLVTLWVCFRSYFAHSASLAAGDQALWTAGMDRGIGATDLPMQLLQVIHQPIDLLRQTIASWLQVGICSHVPVLVYLQSCPSIGWKTDGGGLDSLSTITFALQYSIIYSFSFWYTKLIVY